MMSLMLQWFSFRCSQSFQLLVRFLLSFFLIALCLSVSFVKIDIFLHYNAENCYLFVAGTKAIYNRYKIETDCQCGET